MADTAADVPAKYDVVINGHGYCFLDSVEPSIPFRTHRAIYGQTQPFVERQNVSNSYGDNAQDFFLSIRQRDWSLGEQQKYFRAGQDGRYWIGSNVDVSTPGQVTLSPAVGTLTFAASVGVCCRHPGFGNTSAAVATTTNLYKVDVTGTITDLGAHGLGVAPYRQFGMTIDGDYLYMSSPFGGSVGVRRYDPSGPTFSTFSATKVGSLAFLNNTLYGQDGQTFYQFDSAGTATSIFEWKTATAGPAQGVAVPKLHSLGGKLLIAFTYAQESSELWIYDGSGVSRLEVFPENFWINDVDVMYGVAYIGGLFVRVKDATHSYVRPAVMFYDGSQIGLLWQANDFSTVSTTTTNITGQVLPAPSLGVSNGRLVFTDETTGAVMAYDPVRGGVSSVGTFTPNSAEDGASVSTGELWLQTRGSTTGYYFPQTTYPSSGYVVSSLVDFDSSLPKVFRSVTVEFVAATDGNGGSVDVSYQLDGLAGSWTSLATGVTSGAEVTFPSNTTGHAVAVKITLNKGTSTAGPTVRAMSLRGAPVMPIYARATYLIDCTATADAPRELRDGSYHPLTGHDQVANLVTARNSTTPISITDRVNGTFTAFVDVNDPEGFDVYEVHPALDDPSRAGNYVVRLTVRGV